MNFIDIKATEDKFQVETYKKLEISVERGEGVWVWDSNGDKFLDLYGGHAVCATGHSHPKVVNAIKDQADKVLFYSNLVYSEIRAKASEKLVSIAPASITKTFFCNSGTEANENAMRMARMVTGRENIVSFDGGFHGRTADSISATFLGKYREIGRPNVPHHIEATFNDIENIRTVVDDQTAGVIIEPIQSMAGVREASPEFFIELKKVCDAVGALLIFDEVQTGIGRIGNWFFAGSKHAGGVIPDIITLAKSLGSGIPVGACLVNDKVSSNIKINDFGTTFGGGMISMAAVLATLNAIESENMIDNAREIEMYLRESLDDVPEIKQIHGKGCLIGIEFNEPCNLIHEKLLQNNIITGTSSNASILRLLPPLTVSKNNIDQFVSLI